MWLLYQVFDLLEDKQIDYIVVARLMGVLGARFWSEGLGATGRAGGAAECYQARRFVKPSAHRGVRFPAGAAYRAVLAMPGYTYAVYVLSTFIHNSYPQLYLGRADSENRIGLLRDFAISGFDSKFWATEAAFRMTLCAYNLMSLFRQSALGAASKHTLSTLRAQCFAIGASLGRVGHNQLLRLGLPATRRPWFEGLFSVVQALNIHTQLNRT
jgi:hypothetical protein